MKLSNIIRQLIIGACQIGVILLVGNIGIARGKQLKILDYYNTMSQCRKENDNVYHRAYEFFGPKMTYTQFSIYYDGVMGECVHKEFVK